MESFPTSGLYPRRRLPRYRPLGQYLQEMERTAAVVFTIGLLLVCLYWAYGYIRRRSKNRY